MGRRIGKSTFAQMWDTMVFGSTYCNIVKTALVDDDNYFTIKCSKDVADWIRQQPGKQQDWYEHMDNNMQIDGNMFDLSDSLYMVLKLRWPT